ncbi:hypothetical protein KR215_007891, partial [Drosophila sulfurigaster]
QAQGKFKSLKCQCLDPEIGNFSKCEIRAVSRTRNVINVIFNIRETVASNIAAHVGFFKRTNAWHPFLYSFDMDVCRFFKKPYNIIAIISVDYLRPYSNLNHTCPFVAGSAIVVKDFELDIDDLRSRFPIPNGEYGLRLSVKINNILKATVNGSIYYFDYKDQ